jgi:hypothetical protein
VEQICHLRKAPSRRSQDGPPADESPKTWVLILFTTGAMLFVFTFLGFVDWIDLPENRAAAGSQPIANKYPVFPLSLLHQGEDIVNTSKPPAGGVVIEK